MLKDAIEAQRELKVEPLLTAWQGTQPPKAVTKVIYFLFEVTRAEFEAREEIAKISRLRKAQDLRCRKIQGEMRYQREAIQLKEQHEDAEEEIDYQLDSLDGIVYVQSEERRKRLNHISEICESFSPPPEDSTSANPPSS